MNPGRVRSGYAYLWALMLIAVIATLTATVAVKLSTNTDTANVQSTAKTLSLVAAGVDSFNKYVKSSGGANATPERLSLLDTTVVNGGQSGCSTQTYNATSVTQWTTNAPFLDTYFPTGGLWTPLGRINDAPSKTAATEGTQRTVLNDLYFIQISSLDVALARALDLYVDGTINATSGKVRYTTPAADSTVLLSYEVILIHPSSC